MFMVRVDIGYSFSSSITVSTMQDRYRFCRVRGVNEMSCIRYGSHYLCSRSEDNIEER